MNISTRKLKSEFRYAARRGRGAAYLIAEAHPEVDFSEIIIEIAQRNFAYDGQCEPTRSEYVYELHTLSRAQARIRRVVADSLTTIQTEVWNATQLAELVMLFARDGDVRARKALYHCFTQVAFKLECDWLGADEIIRLDGLTGFQFVVRHYGKALKKRAVEWPDERAIKLFQEHYPESDAWATLRQLAETDTDINRFLQNVEKTIVERRDASPTQPEVISLTDLIAQPAKIGFGDLQRLRRAGGPSATELRVLAERLLVEKNGQILENLLYVFSKFPYPSDPEPLLNFAQKFSNRKYRIQEFAIGALAFLSKQSIRDFALSALASSNEPVQFTHLLKHNYLPGDAVLLTKLAERARSEHIIEGLVVSYLKIYEQNPTPECAEPLLVLYRKMTCGLHRTDVVAFLLKNGVLPSWVNEELPFDCDEKTRKLHVPTLN